MDAEPQRDPNPADRPRPRGHTVTFTYEYGVPLSARDDRQAARGAPFGYDTAGHVTIIVGPRPGPAESSPPAA